MVIDLVILSLGQMKRTTSEVASDSQNFYTMGWQPYSCGLPNQYDLVCHGEGNIRNNLILSAMHPELGNREIYPFSPRSVEMRQTVERRTLEM
ncbi:hypothetical protein TNCV_3116001 [Trichonephila clavipes]|nr:hypothetical protein TNCV_3116001 [Trichonephila clavipes]